MVFAASVAIGAALTPREDLVEALFGQYERLTLFAFAIGSVAILAIIAFIFSFKNELTLALFSPELGASAGIHLDRLNLYFLLAFSMTVLVGLRFLGGLLAGALIIIPATTGRRLAGNLSQFLLASSVASVAAVGIGFLLSYVFHIAELGPTIVLTSAVIFALSLLKTSR